MKTITLSSSLKLPIDAVTQQLAFLARKGAGKTYAAGKFAEGLCQLGAQVVIIDPVGIWWGLRLAADGKKPGIEIPVFGGKAGDVPLDPRGGAFIADLVVDRSVSVVIDVSFMRKGERKQFATDFAEQFFHKKKLQKQPTPVHVIIEEAQKFIPQRMSRGDERMVGAMEDIARLGRNYGIGVSLISQRPQSINKEVLNQSECLVVLQTVGPQEKKAIQGWIAEKASIKDAAIDHIASLPVGTAWVWSPQWLRVFKKVKIGKKWTYDASKTPVFGAKTKKTGKLAPVDLEKIRVAMAETIKKAKAVDPKFLRKKINELEVQVKRLTTQKAKEAIEVEVPSVPKGFNRDMELLGSMMDSLKEGQGQCASFLERAEQHLSEMKVSLENLGVRDVMKGRAVEKTTTVSAALARRISAEKSASARVEARQAGRETVVGAQFQMQQALNKTGGNPVLGSGARRILETLGRWYPGKLTKGQLATLAKFKNKSSGTYSNYLSNLKQAGLTETDGKHVWLSKEGAAATDTSRPPETTEEILGHWYGVLPGGASRILEILVAIYPDDITRDELAERGEFKNKSSGTFSNYLSNLRTNGLAETNGSMVVAGEVLFKEAG